MKPFTEQSFEAPALVVVAHWDDEVFNAAGLLMRHGPLCTVVCATHLDHYAHNRRKVFKRIVVNEFKAKALNLSIRQRSRKFYPGKESKGEYCKTAARTVISLEVVRLKLTKVLEGSRYPTVITHHPEGDFGRHPQHCEVSKAIIDMFGEVSRIFHFVREPNAFIGKCEQVNRYCGSRSTHALTLTHEEFIRKVELIKRYKKLYPEVKIPRTEYYSLRPIGPQAGEGNHDDDSSRHQEEI